MEALIKGEASFSIFVLMFIRFCSSSCLCPSRFSPSFTPLRPRAFSLSPGKKSLLNFPFVTLKHSMLCVCVCVCAGVL